MAATKRAPEEACKLLRETAAVEPVISREDRIHFLCEAVLNVSDTHAEVVTNALGTCRDFIEEIVSGLGVGGLHGGSALEVVSRVLELLAMRWEAA